MNELQQSLIGDSYAAPPSNILQSISDDLAHLQFPGIEHSIYAELWHVAYWQQLYLDWIAGLLTPYPVHAADGFPGEFRTGTSEPWISLHHRFLKSAHAASDLAGDTARHSLRITRPARETGTTRSPQFRSMTVREQLEGLATHNAYHLGRIVLLRQLFHAWPPPSGGDTW